MGNSARHVLIHRRNLPQASIPWICPWNLQKHSGLRESYNSRSKSSIGGVVWNMHQSTSKKCHWVPDAVDVLNVVMVKDIVRHRLGKIDAFLKEAHENAVLILGISDHANKHDPMSDESLKYNAAVLQASHHQLTAISHHYDSFSDYIISMYVICFLTVLLICVSLILPAQRFPPICELGIAGALYELREGIQYLEPRFCVSTKVCQSQLFAIVESSFWKLHFIIVLFYTSFSAQFESNFKVELLQYQARFVFRNHIFG
jgi:hypothetical protein